MTELISPRLASLPLLLWKTPPGLELILAQEGVAFETVKDPHPLSFRAGHRLPFEVPTCAAFFVVRFFFGFSNVLLIGFLPVVFAVIAFLLLVVGLVVICFWRVVVGVERKGLVARRCCRSRATFIKEIYAS